VLVDKPAGKSSHDVVQHVRHALGIRAAGHTGTLDPFATGLLVVLVGRATRLARFVEAQPKTYLGTGRLGIRTTTDDLTGEAIGAESAELVPEALVRDTLAAFRGTQAQRPPQFSAKKVGGERSYRRARRGELVELADVDITVHEITLVAYQPPEFDFRVTVSAGTYVRAIARDLGEQLGVGAHLTRLRREAIGSLRVEHAVTLDQLSPAALVPPRQVLADLPAMDLDEAARKDVTHGRAVADNEAAGRESSGPGTRKAGGDSGSAVALLASGELVAVARAEKGWLYPIVVLEGQ
jgi:tRNA pseudouridine55 synthase